MKMVIVAVVLVLICTIAGGVFASIITSTPELCNLIPALIDPETCVSVQTGGIGTLFVISGAAFGFFFGCVLSFILYVAIQIFSTRARINSWTPGKDW